MTETAFSFCIIFGDWNAKIGQTREKSEYIGNYGLGSRNERGDRLEEFSVLNSFIIGNTWFYYHPRRLWTWMSPGDRARNQIDYIMVKKRWRTSLQNVKTRPGADCGSDHQLLVAKLRHKFSVEVNNKFELLLRNDEAEQTPNELWEDMKETVKMQQRITSQRKGSGNNHGSQIRLSTLLMTGRGQNQNEIEENGRD